MKMAEEQNMLEKIRATVALMEAIVDTYCEGKISRDEAFKQLSELEADIKSIEPDFPIMNAAAILDDAERKMNGYDDYYDSSEYEDSENN
jgi:predicted transcriptional regulator